MGLPTQLSDVLQGRLDGVTRLVVRHERRSSFRLLALIELPLKLAIGIALFACLCPLTFSWLRTESPKVPPRCNAAPFVSRTRVY